MLHLEDAPRDAEVVRSRLELDGLPCDILVADTKRDFESALEHEPFDLIICDYNLPAYDGVTALKRALTIQPDVPVILVSGTVGEEEAVKCLQMGAIDYLLKGRLDRLGSAVRRAIQEAQSRLTRKRAEEALAQSEKRKAAVLESVLDCIVTMDADGLVTEFNAAAERTFGYSKGQAIGRPLVDLIVPPAYREAHAVGLAHYFATGVGPFLGRCIEIEAMRSDGSCIPVELTISVIISDSATTFTGVLRDITTRKRDAEVARKRAEDLEREIVERHRAEAAVRAERDRAQRYLDAPEVILLALDATGRVTLANRYACSLLGVSSEELLGRDWIDCCLPPRIRATSRAQLRDLGAGDVSVVESPVITKAGDERLIAWHHTVQRNDAGEVVGTFSSGTDVTESRALETQYRQAQKMEAIGQLAGGVAHDFNNLLTVILGNCELLLEDLQSDPRRHADVAEIQKAGLSAASLTRQLLAFSRKEIIEPARLDLNVVLAEMRPMLTRLIREDVQVVLRLGQEPAPIEADRGQIEQVVLNLAVNARDAMPTGGTLTIGVAVVILDEQYARTHLAVEPGSYSALTVTDTGTGMTPEVQAHVFEPFFTTKPAGRGTGLGLATVHGIVARSGGSIDLSSSVGAGTSITLYFPRAKETEEVVEMPPAVTRARAAAATVLLVEDADGLRLLTTKLLRRHGFTVLVAENADEALQLFEENPSIDVLLTDVVMPGGSGPELSRRLLARWPALKVIYMSGYTDETIVHHGVLEQGVAFLHKPFTSQALGRKVRDALGS